MNNDYYAILGIKPTAKIADIKSAYRQLIRRYHPDKYRGDPQEALEKSEAINSAFDALTRSKTQPALDVSPALTVTTAAALAPTGAIARPNASDWETACSCVDTLEPLYQNLQQLSPTVADAFKHELLNSKRYDAALSIAREHQDRFLATYYGSNPRLHFFALWLLHHQHRAIAKELNHLVSVMGLSVDADSIIQHLVAEHRLNYQLQKHTKRPSRQSLYRGRHSHWGSGLVWLLVSILLLAAAIRISDNRF